MTTTPPVNSQIKTPPTPLHGSKYPHPRQTRSNQASNLSSSDSFVSPPASPTGLLSPRADASHEDSEGRRALKKGKGKSSSSTTMHEDPFSSFAPSGLKKLRPFNPPPSSLQTNNPFQKPAVTASSSAADSYPTPAKTPSKKRKYMPPSALEELSKSSRKLFPITESTSTTTTESTSTTTTSNALFLSTATASSLESSLDVIPRLPRRNSPKSSLKKRRKGSVGILPNVFEEAPDLDGRNRRPEKEEIQIYTDSNERIPEFDPDPNNPFIDHPGVNDGEESEDLGKAKRKLRKRRAANKEEFRKAGGDREDGMLYMFRGKKIFRKFDRDNSSILGHPQPRILFPSARQLRERERRSMEENIEQDEDDHEVATDIDEVAKEEVAAASGETSVTAAVGSNPFVDNNIAPKTPEKKRDLTEVKASKQKQKEVISTTKGKEENVDEDEEEDKEPEELEPPRRASSVAPSVSSVASSTILNFGPRPRITKSVSNLSNHSEGGASKMVDGLRRSKRLYSEEHEHIEDARTALAMKLAGGKRAREESGLDVEKWAYVASGPTRKRTREKF